MKSATEQGTSADIAAAPAARSRAGRPARIRLSLVALTIPAVTLFCVLPLATAGGFWAAAFVLPVAALALVLAAGTTATERHLSARWWFGRRRLAWEDVDQIEFPSSRWAVAVTHAGERMVLPAVRPRDLPAIVAAAGGRLFLQRPVSTGERVADGTTGGAEDDVTGGNAGPGGRAGDADGVEDAAADPT